MRIEFDRAKDVANRARHDVSLAIAEELDWDSALVWVDRRFDYDEIRMSALAPRASTLYFVFYVERGDRTRIISVRRASRKELKYYFENA
jgi:uncharacterized DUF497 family protein